MRIKKRKINQLTKKHRAEYVTTNARSGVFEYRATRALIVVPIEAEMDT